jgi:hypothetical protein
MERRGPTTISQRGSQWGSQPTSRKPAKTSSKTAFANADCVLDSPLATAWSARSARRKSLMAATPATAYCFSRNRHGRQGRRSDADLSRCSMAHGWSRPSRDLPPFRDSGSRYGKHGGRRRTRITSLRHAPCLLKVHQLEPGWCLGNLHLSIGVESPRGAGYLRKAFVAAGL